MQRGEAFVVLLADVGTAVNQLADGGILAMKTGQVECCVPKCIGLVYLSMG